MFKAQGMDAVILTHNIDQPFVSQLESKNEDIRFLRIDADLTDSFKEETTGDEKEDIEAESKALSELFKKVLNKEQLSVTVEKLKDENISSVLTISEESRRMMDMMKMYSAQGLDMGMFGSEGENLILNANNELVKYIFNNQEADNVSLFVEQLYDLAVIANKPLGSEAMTRFVNRSNQIMKLLMNK